MHASDGARGARRRPERRGRRRAAHLLGLETEPPARGLPGRRLPREIDILHCDRCQGRMRRVALVLEDKNITRFLRSLGEPTSLPARAPARGPPYCKSRVLRRALQRRRGRLNGGAERGAVTNARNSTLIPPFRGASRRPPRPRTHRPRLQRPTPRPPHRRKNLLESPTHRVGAWAGEVTRPDCTWSVRYALRDPHDGLDSNLDRALART